MAKKEETMLYRFGEFVLVEWRDDAGGLELYTADTLPPEHADAPVHRMNPFQFVSMCEDARIRAFVRFNPQISQQTKAWLSGFDGKLDTSDTPQGRAEYQRFLAMQAGRR